jgi:hypothetical protein
LQLQVPDLSDTPPAIYHLGGSVLLEVKHRQLSRQVGVFIVHPLENSMVFFDFTNAMLDEGATFIFGSWICVAGGAGSFRWHLVDDMNLEASTASQRSSLNKFINNLDVTLLPYLTTEIEEESLFNVISTWATLVLLRSDLIWSKDLCTLLPFVTQHGHYLLEAHAIRDPLRIGGRLGSCAQDRRRMLQLLHGSYQQGSC